MRPGSVTCIHGSSFCVGIVFSHVDVPGDVLLVFSRCLAAHTFRVIVPLPCPLSTILTLLICVFEKAFPPMSFLWRWWNPGESSDSESFYSLNFAVPAGWLCVPSQVEQGHWTTTNTTQEKCRHSSGYPSLLDMSWTFKTVIGLHVVMLPFLQIYPWQSRMNRYLAAVSR